MPRIHRVYGYVFSTFPLGTLSFLKRGTGKLAFRTEANLSPKEPVLE